MSLGNVRVTMVFPIVYLPTSTPIVENTLVMLTVENFTHKTFVYFQSKHAQN